VKEIRELTAVFSDQLGPEGQAARIKEALERGTLTAGMATREFERLIEIFRNDAVHVLPSDNAFLSLHGPQVEDPAP
jgi:hypothetical protein